MYAEYKMPIKTKIVFKTLRNFTSGIIKNWNLGDLNVSEQ
jgi:hypothetical protein